MSPVFAVMFSLEAYSASNFALTVPELPFSEWPSIRSFSKSFVSTAISVSFKSLFVCFAKVFNISIEDAMSPPVVSKKSSLSHAVFFAEFSGSRVVTDFKTGKSIIGIHFSRIVRIVLLLNGFTRMSFMPLFLYVSKSFESLFAVQAMIIPL